MSNEHRLELNAQNGMLVLGVACVLFALMSVACRAEEAIVMWLDTRASTNDQKAVTHYIHTEFKDSNEIDLAKVAKWHVATNYSISGWVLSADYAKTVKRGVDMSALFASISAAATNLERPDYVKWFLVPNAYQSLRNAGYIATTNRLHP